MSSVQNKEPAYRVYYKINYAGTKEQKTGQYVHPNMHPREDQVLRQIIRLEPALAEAEYLSVEIQLNSANLGYKPYFGVDKSSIQAFLSQMHQFT